MNKLKYKAYDTEKGEWLTSENLIYNNGLWFENFRALEDYIELSVDNGDVMIVQFTGMVDKHGNEIFEGDIIQWKDVVAYYETHCGPNIPSPTNTYTERYDTRVQVCVDRVLFVKGSFVLSRDAECDCIPLDFSECYGQGFDITDEDMEQLTEDDYFKKFGYDSIDALIKDVTSGIEVIGNVFENPELLERS